MSARAARWLVLAPLLAFACGRSAGPPGLTVYGASSLTDALTEIGHDFESATGEQVRLSFGGSDTLARQILAGAGADLFLSASADWMAELEQQGALAGPAVPIAANRLAVVVPTGRYRPRGPQDLARPDLRRIAIAHESVPAGAYAREALDRWQLTSALAPRLVGQKDVRAVLRAVAAGEADAGFVYRTDARVEPRVEIGFEIDPALHRPITYPAAVLRASRHPSRARDLLDYLTSPPAQAILARHGFDPPR